MLYEWAPCGGVIARVVLCQCGAAHEWPPVWAAVIYGLVGEDRWYALNEASGKGPRWWLSIPEMLDTGEGTVGDEDVALPICTLLGIPWAELDHNAIMSMLQRMDDAPLWFAQAIMGTDALELAGLREWVVGSDVSRVRALGCVWAHETNRELAHAHPDTRINGGGNA